MNDNTKRITFLCQYFYPEYVSSAVLPFETAKALVKEGYHVSAICGYPVEYSLSEKVKYHETYEGISIKRVKYGLFRKENKSGRIINYLILIIQMLFRFMQLRNSSLIIVYSNPPILPVIAALAYKAFSVKVIFVSYDVYPEIAEITRSISKNGFISKIMRLLNGVIFKNVSGVIALSDEMKNYLLLHHQELNKEKVVVIHNWSHDYNHLIQKKNTTCKETEEPPVVNEFVISYLGNLGVCQDAETIIGAIRKLKYQRDIKFYFAGHGTKFDLVRRIVRDEGIRNVDIDGFLHGGDYISALSRSDAFLVSLAKGIDCYAVPSKVSSYMMAGKPVIEVSSCETEMSKDILDNKAGFVIEIGDSDQLVKAILTLKEDPSLRFQMGINSYGIYKKKYTYEISMGNYVTLIKNLLN